MKAGNAVVHTDAAQTLGKVPVDVDALGKACEIAGRDLTKEQMTLRGLREHLLSKLRAGVEGLVLHGDPAKRLPNTLFLSFPGVHGARLLDAVPDIAASTSSACHSGSSAPCASLVAIGVDPGLAVGPVRLSLGRNTTVQDVEQAADLLVAGWKRLRPRSAITAAA